MTGCMLVLLELVSIANNSGPRDVELKEYCPDQVDSSESTLELLARELRVDCELMLERLLELIDRREPSADGVPSLLEFDKGCPKGAINAPCFRA